MKKIFTSIITIFAFLLLNMVSLIPHASAMSMTSHAMGGMNHKADSSVNCATLCRTAVVNKKDTISPRLNKEEDEPIVSFYILQNEGWGSYDIGVNQKLYAESVKPPSKIPIYLLYSVFRV